MKNKSIISHGILLLLFCVQAIALNAQQVAVVGEVRNNVGVVTNNQLASSVLKGGLSSSAVISNMRIEWVGGDENKYYLVGSISGDNISSKGIQLQQIGTQLRASGGPGVEISCMGHNCSSCKLIWEQWTPRCVCSQSNGQSGESYCEMNSKYIITPW